MRSSDAGAAVLVAMVATLSIGCAGGPPPHALPHDLQADRRSACHAAFASLLDAKPALAEPIYVDAGAACADVLDEVEKRALTTELFVEPWPRDPGDEYTCPGRCGPDDGGTIVRVHRLEFLPSSSPAPTRRRSGDVLALDVPCSAQSEGRQVEVTFSERHRRGGFGGKMVLASRAGRWLRLEPGGETYVVY
jgi:hypothetical protein